MRWVLLVFSLFASVLAVDACRRERIRDPASKAYLSPVVVLGRSTDVALGETFVRARFNVRKVLKNAEHWSKHKKKIRLEYRNATFCQLPENLRPAQDYLVFMRVNYSQLEAAFLPEPADRGTMRDVRRIACYECAKPPSVQGLDDVVAKSGKRLRLHCKARGNPLPSIHWYKNGEKIKRRGRIKIRHRRKQSSLIIKSVSRNDEGEYECRASNVVQREPASSRGKVMVIDNSQTPTPSPNEGFGNVGSPCPMTTFCLNGGNCTFYEMFGEYVCKCAEGYTGQRCGYKRVPILLGEVNPYLRSVTGFVP